MILTSHASNSRPISEHGIRLDLVTVGLIDVNLRAPTVLICLMQNEFND